AFHQRDYPRVVALLDPLVDGINKADSSQEKENLQKNPDLATALLQLALNSNIQLGKIDRTEQVLEVLDKVRSDGADAGTTNILQLLAALIRQQVEEVRKRGDKEALKKATEGYSKILAKRISKQKTLTPEFIRVLADCYSSMGEHARAAGELEKVPDPRAKPGSPEETNYRAIQLLHIRELRLTKDPASIKKARKQMDA